MIILFDHKLVQWVDTNECFYRFSKHTYPTAIKYFNKNKKSNTLFVAIEIFNGENNDFSKAVCLNAAAGLIVNNTFQNFNDAYNNAREHILSGKAFKHLLKLQNVWKYIRKNYQYKKNNMKLKIMQVY